MLLNTIHGKLTREQEEKLLKIQDDWFDEVDKYRKEHPIHFTEVTVEEISKMGDEKLIFLDRPGRMGSEDAHFVIQKNGEFNYYITNRDGYRAVIETFKSLEDYKNNKDDENLENYVSVYIGFGAMVFVHNDIFETFNKFIEIKRSRYNTDDLQMFRCLRLDLSKMFIDGLTSSSYDYSKGKGDDLKFDD